MSACVHSYAPAACAAGIPQAVNQLASQWFPMVMTVAGHQVQYSNTQFQSAGGPVQYGNTDTMRANTTPPCAGPLNVPYVFWGPTNDACWGTNNGLGFVYPPAPQSAPAAAPLDDVRQHRQCRATPRGFARDREEADAAPAGAGEKDGCHDAEIAREQADALLAKLRVDNADVSEEFRTMAFTSQASSRAAQLALEGAKGAEAVTLANGLRGHVKAAVESRYANYVVQRIVEMLPPASAEFVTRELIGISQEIARHRSGCRVICRLLEFGSPTDPLLNRLIYEILDDAKDLCRHAFGNYVLRHILEHGLQSHQTIIVQGLRADVMANAHDPFGSRVAEDAFQFCQHVDRDSLAADLLAGGIEQMLNLAQGKCSCHVVKKLLRLPSERRWQAMQYLQPVAAQLRGSEYGRHVVNAMSNSTF